MSNPADSVRRLVDETVVSPRHHSQSRLLAATIPRPIPVGSSRLLYLWDEYGTEMLDFAAELNPLGHRHQRTYAVVTDHMRYYGLTAPQGRHLLRWPVDYAVALSESLPGSSEGRKVLFCEGEREAVLVAGLLASARSGGPRTAVLDTGWHDWLPSRDLMSPHADTSALDPARHGGLLIALTDTAAHLVPRVQDWAEAARRSSIPVIIDESVSGFGRLGSLWGQEGLGLLPDLTVLGGPAGGGLPLGAVIGGGDFFGPEVVDVSRLSGHPWSCAAGAETLSGVHPGIIEHLADVSALFSENLDSLVGQFPDQLYGHHGTGMLRGLRFRDSDRAAAFPGFVAHRGLHVSPSVGSTVVLAPPLVISDHELSRGVDIIADALICWEDQPDQVNLSGSVQKP